jgi:hypothetical protein
MRRYSNIPAKRHHKYLPVMGPIGPMGLIGVRPALLSVCKSHWLNQSHLW